MSRLRYMRLIIFFDLPTSTKKDRKNYTKFRTYLINEGFVMTQYSVYTRICNGRDSVDKYLGRVKKNTPERGHIRALSVTEKQWQDMKILIGEKSVQEEKLTSEAITFFLNSCNF